MTRDLSTLLKLTPLTDPAIPFAQFLQELNQHPERADTAPALVLRALEEMGVEKPEDEPDPERKQFLRMLRDFGIPSLKAFKHAVGSQRFALRVLSWLSAASNGGAQLRQMLIIEGGPGAGKDFFKDGIFAALEKHGKVYAVQGCPEHENPVNLLKLLKPEQLQELAEATGLGDKLWNRQKQKPGILLSVAGEPCQNCYRQVMGDIKNPNPEPSLDAIKVESIRLSKRSIGIAEWKPGQDVSLEATMRKGQRGMISMPDAFIEREPEPGKTDERLLLLDAIPERRLPGLATDSDGVPAPSPSDIFALATTNEKALKKFLESLPDKDAFTGRSTLLKQGYNLFRVEEKRAYRGVYEGYRVKSHFDPLVFDLIATLAVISRYVVPAEGKPFAHPIDKLRLYQGEQILINPRSGSQWDEVWSTRSSGYGGYGGGYGGYGGYGSSRSSSSSSSDEKKAEGEKPELPADQPCSTEALWAVAGPDEGLVGLDMRFMLGLLSSLNEFGLNATPGSKHQCVNSLQVVELLRMAVNSKLGNSNLTEEQEQVLKRCQKWLGGKPGAAFGSEKPSLIEGELRRLLRNLLLNIFAPDYFQRAQKLYEDYKLHATAAFLGEKQTVRHPREGEIPIDHGLIDELDRFRLGKAQKDKDGRFTQPLSDEDKKFRGGLEGQIELERDDFIAAAGDDPEKRKEAARRFKETWETIPELAAAIRAKLDAEVSALAEKLLTTDVTADLSDLEQEQLKQAKQEFERLGFCPSCSKPVLEYAKRVRVWTYKG